MEIVQGEASSLKCVHTTVTEEDTDISTLLFHHANDNEFKLYYHRDVRGGLDPQHAISIVS